MKKYRYKVFDQPIGEDDLLCLEDRLNKGGKRGWRLVVVVFEDQGERKGKRKGCYTAVMEREVPEPQTQGPALPVFAEPDIGTHR